MKRTPWISTLALTLVALGGACGSSDGGDGDGAGLDTEAAGAVAVDFFEAFGTAEYAKACDVLSEPERDRMTETEDSLASQEGRTSAGCAGGLEYNFRPDPIDAPKVAETQVYNGAVEVFLTTGTEQNLRAQVIEEDGEWKVDEFSTVISFRPIEPLCDDAADEPSELPAPEDEWLLALRDDYYQDFTDDRVATSTGVYTQVLVDELQTCGMEEAVFEQLIDSVAVQSPTSLNAPPEYTFTSIGTDQFFTCQLVNVAANTYEVTSCTTVDATG